MPGRKINKVALAGSLLGILSFGLSFLILRPNRIASGTAFYIWNISLPYEILILVVLWLIVIIQALAGRDYKYHFHIIGIIGNLILVLIFLIAARSSKILLANTNQPFSRVSLGFGTYIMALAAYILMQSSLKKIKASLFIKIFLSSAGFFILAILLFLGYFNNFSIMQEYFVREQRFLAEVVQHIFLSISAVAIAILIGTLFGILAFRKRVLDKPIFFFVNTVQTIPSLALFGLMITPLAILSGRFPFLRNLGIQGIGWAPALIAISLYALLPITRNTYTSLKIIDPAIIESGIGIGMSKFQLLYKVQIPLSLPVFLSGARTSIVLSIGNTTVAALIGAGGLGVFVFQGLGQAVPDLILLGSLPVIMIAVFTDKVMDTMIRLVTPKGVARELEP